jgi:hypothetical protein
VVLGQLILTLVLVVVELVDLGLVFLENLLVVEPLPKLP